MQSRSVVPGSERKKPRTVAGCQGFFVQKLVRLLEADTKKRFCKYEGGGESGGEGEGGSQTFYVWGRGSAVLLTRKAGG